MPPVMGAFAMAYARLFLSGANVDRAFRDELFSAADRAGMTPGEFAIQAAAEKLATAGARFPGVFKPNVSLGDAA